MSLEQIFKFIDKNETKYLEELRTYVKQPSISTQNKGIEDCAELVKKMMDKIGFETNIIQIKNGYPVVYGEIMAKKNEKTIIFYNHYDIQPPEPLEEWETDPFGGEIKEGRMYGRGISDNKANFTYRIQAIEALLEQLGEISTNVKFVVEGEEEMGSPNLLGFINDNKKMLEADGCIWEGGAVDAEGVPHIRLGNKGILYVELRTKGAKVDAHSMNAPLIENPAWKAVWALNTFKDNKERITIDGFHDDIREPNKEEYNFVNNTEFGLKEFKETYGLNTLLPGDNNADIWKKFLFEPTCTICGFDSGYKGKGTKTVLPSKSVVKVDFRLVADQRPDDILKKVRKHLDKHNMSDVEVVKITVLEPSKTPINDPFVKEITKQVKDVYKKEPVIWPTSPGSGPRYLFTNELNLPTAGIGISNFESNIHAPNENIKIKDYMQGVKLIASMFK